MKQLAIIICLCVIGVTNAYANYISDDGFWTFSIIDEATNKVSIKNYAGDETEELTIPSYFKYQGVEHYPTGIAKRAFNGCEFSSIVIPPCINTIESEAFYNCTKLKDVHYNASLDEPVGNDGVGEIFCNCDSLRNLTIGEDVALIPDYLFSHYLQFETLQISKSVTEIGTGAFRYCNFGSIIVDPLNPKYDSRDDCNAIIETATNRLIVGGKNTIIPNSATLIGHDAINSISEDDPIYSITIPDNVIEIEGRNGAIKVIWLANTPPTNYYYFSASRTHFVPNESYTYLTAPTVYPNLSSMFEVDGIKYVPTGDSTCDAIDCVYHPEITEFTLSKDVLYNGITFELQNITSPLFIANPYLERCKISDEYDGEIPSYTFSNCKNLQEVSISNGISTIRKYTFEGCTSLQSITIPDNVLSIESSAFEGCSSLQNITIPSNVLSIGNYAFNGCLSLADVIIADRETTLSTGNGGYGYDELFSDCPLKSVYIGGNIAYPKYDSTDTDASAYSPFSNPTLESVVISANVTLLGRKFFYGCRQVSSITCHATVPPTLGSGVFDGIDKSSCELIIPEKSIDAYKEADGWKDFFASSGYKCETSDIVSNTNISIENGNIVVGGAGDMPVFIEVYNISGNFIYSGHDIAIPVAAGTYIVKVAGKIFKVAL